MSYILYKILCCCHLTLNCNSQSQSFTYDTYFLETWKFILLIVYIINALFAIKVQVFCNYYLDPSCQLCVILLTVLTNNDNSGSLPQTVSIFWIWLATKKQNTDHFHIFFVFSILYISPWTSISTLDPNDQFSLILAYTHSAIRGPTLLIFNFLELVTMCLNQKLAWWDWLFI